MAASNATAAAFLSGTWRARLNPLCSLAPSLPVAALEGLALSDPDPRVRRACTLPLAMLCHTVKRAGGLSGGGAATAADGQGSHKGLAQLPADGALRPLLESLLEGRWVLPSGGCWKAG